MFSEKSSENLDDLIGSSQQPIIVQDGGSDKKFLYTLLILLVILFMIALGLIAFLGGKYFGDNSAKGQRVEQVAKTQVSEVAPVQKVAPMERKVVTQKVAKPVVKEDTSISELENLVQAEEKPKPKTTIEKTISRVAPAKKGGLSREEMAMIAKLVAKELEKSKASSANAQSSTNGASSGSTNQKDAALMKSLESAQTDTLQEEQIDTKVVKGDVKANSGKKVDTFNKVIVSKKPAQNDELAQLSAEIDTILGSEDVKKAEQNLKYKKSFERENAQRAKELRFIVVKRGDTLSSIAYRAYGRASAYVKIYNANPDLVKNPNRIYVGMRLRVPVDEEYKAAQAGN